MQVVVQNAEALVSPVAEVRTFPFHMTLWNRGKYLCSMNNARSSKAWFCLATAQMFCFHEEYGGASVA